MGFKAFKKKKNHILRKKNSMRHLSGSHVPCILYCFCFIGNLMFCVIKHCFSENEELEEKKLHTLNLSTCVDSSTNKKRKKEKIQKKTVVMYQVSHDTFIVAICCKPRKPHVKVSGLR